MSTQSATSIVVGFDDSDASSAALAWAADAAVRLDAHVDVVWVLPSAVAWELAAIQVDSEKRRRQMVDRLRRVTREHLQPHGIRYATHVREGSPAATLAQEAQRLRSALLVIGASHRGLVGDLFMGSVAHDLVHRAPLPVVVVPPSWHCGSGTETNARPIPATRTEASVRAS